MQRTLSDKWDEETLGIGYNIAKFYIDEAQRHPLAKVMGEALQNSRKLDPDYVDNIYSKARSYYDAMAAVQSTEFMYIRDGYVHRGYSADQLVTNPEFINFLKETGFEVKEGMPDQVVTAVASSVKNYFDTDKWVPRVIREELHDAAKNGVGEIYFPTLRTAADIEGWTTTAIRRAKDQAQGVAIFTGVVREPEEVFKVFDGVPAGAYRAMRRAYNRGGSATNVNFSTYWPDHNLTFSQIDKFEEFFSSRPLEAEALEHLYTASGRGIDTSEDFGKAIRARYQSGTKAQEVIQSIQTSTGNNIDSFTDSTGLTEEQVYMLLKSTKEFGALADLYHKQIPKYLGKESGSQLMQNSTDYYSSKYNWVGVKVNPDFAAKKIMLPSALLGAVGLSQLQGESPESQVDQEMQKLFKER